MMPSFPKFKELELSDRAAVEPILRKYGRGVCEHSFANLFIWKEFDRPTFTFINDCLCVLIRPVDEESFFLEPVGENINKKVVNACLSHVPRMSRVSINFVNDFPDIFNSSYEIPDHHDYVYLVKDQSSLAGRKFSAKRNHIHRFVQNIGNFEYVNITKVHAKEALAVFDEWTHDKLSNDLTLPMINYSCQRLAIVRAFEAFNELQMCGGAIYSKGKMLGFTLATGYNEKIVHLHFAYALPEYQGLMQTLLQQTSANSFESYELVNFEQDLGILGLRNMKLSYHPSIIEKKYEFSLANICQKSLAINN